MVARESFAGTAATVRRALERSFAALPAEDATWRGTAGPHHSEVRVDVEAVAGGGAAVAVRGVVAEAPAPAPAARACLVENDPLLLGRFRHRGDAIVAEQSILGGPTLHPDEVRLAVWTVGWAAGAFAGRFAARLAGREPPAPAPEPDAGPRRGAEERVRSTEERVERFLNELYGTFARHEAWGYHGGFGSARVFVHVRHYLEVSTAITVAAPILLGVELRDGLALEAHAIQDRERVGRVVYVADRRELWVEHGVLGDDLQLRELQDAVDGVARIADGEDDSLRAAFGGDRYADVAGG